MRAKFLIILIILCCSAKLYSQEQRNMELVGLILSTDKTPVPYATIVAKTKNSTVISGVISDDNGYFKLPLSLIPDSIKVRCVGFEEKNMAFEKVSDTIFMSPQVSILEQVVVRGQRPKVKLEGSSMQIHIKGTVLAQESNLVDLLRKIPGVIASGNGISTIDGYVPSFYVNGRKISSMSEIKNIDIKSIKSIELDTSPGARYKSTENAVINIKTTSFLEGTSFVGHTFLRANKRFTHDNSLDFSIKNKAVRLFGGVAYSDYRRRSFQDISTKLNNGNSVINTTLDAVHSNDKEFDYSLGAEYMKDHDWGAGFKYNGSLSNRNYRTMSETNANLPNGTDNVYGNNMVRDKISIHHLNGYLQKEWNNDFLSDLFLDFYLKNGDRNQSVNEHSSIGGNNLANFDNGSSFSMFSIKPVFEYKFSPKISSEFGAEFLQVIGKSDKKINGIKVSEYNTSEITWAGFSSLKAKVKSLNLQVGLRYENMHGRLNNLVDPTESLKLSSSNFFGNFSISTILGHTVHSIALKNSIERPKFGWLNNYSYYSDHYSYQLGNPELKPAVSYQAQYKFIYKFIYLALSYTNTRDFIGNYFYTKAEDPNKLLATWINYHSNQRFQAVINMRYSLGFYHSNLTSSVIFEKMEDKKVNAFKNVPLTYIDFNNNFDLPWDIKLNVEYLYKSKATSQIFSFAPVHIVNLGLNRSFLDGAIDVSIKCKDLFKGDINRYHGSINGIQFSQIEDQDRRSISVNFTWRFNKNKQYYKGQTQNETINRL